MALRHMLLLAALLLMLLGVCRCVFGQDDPCDQREDLMGCECCGVAPADGDVFPQWRYPEWIVLPTPAPPPEVTS